MLRGTTRFRETSFGVIEKFRLHGTINVAVNKIESCWHIMLINILISSSFTVNSHNLQYPVMNFQSVIHRTRAREYREYLSSINIFCWNTKLIVPCNKRREFYYCYR